MKKRNKRKYKIVDQIKRKEIFDAEMKRIEEKRKEKELYIEACKEKKKTEVKVKKPKLIINKNVINWTIPAITDELFEQKLEVLKKKRIQNAQKLKLKRKTVDIELFKGTPSLMSIEKRSKKDDFINRFKSIIDDKVKQILSQKQKVSRLNNAYKIICIKKDESIEYIDTETLIYIKKYRELVHRIEFLSKKWNIDKTVVGIFAFNDRKLTNLSKCIYEIKGIAFNKKQPTYVGLTLGAIKILGEDQSKIEKEYSLTPLNIAA